jgi:malonate-semialdehyde dehydrogenase (acetylating)/methylmalonate-semialdehyde dehydrogenase
VIRAEKAVKLGQNARRPGQFEDWEDVVMRDVGHFIGGKVVKGTSGRQGDVFDPNTGEVQAKVALASKSEVEAAIANAKAAQPAWAATNPQRLARVLFMLVDVAPK